MADGAAKGGLQDRQITLGGKTLTIRMSVRAWIALQDAWDLDEDAVRARVSKARLADLPDIFWAATRTHHKDLSRDEVLDLLDEAGAEGIVASVKKLMEDSRAPQSEEAPPAKA